LVKRIKTYSAMMNIHIVNLVASNKKIISYSANSSLLSLS